MKTILLFCIITLALKPVCSAQWVELNSDNFESYTAGKSPEHIVDSNIPWYTENQSSNSTFVEFVIGQSEERGRANDAGTGNALFLRDESSTRNFGTGFNIGPTGASYDVVYFSFNFTLGQAEAGDSDMTLLQVGLIPADSIELNKSAFTINLRANGSLRWPGNNGDMFQAHLSRVNRLEIIASRKNKVFRYKKIGRDVNETLPSDSFDIYLNDALVGSDVSFADADVELGRIALNSYITTVGANIIVDDVAVYTMTNQ